jgi:hypothetical protein
MRAARLPLALAIFVLAVACQPTASPGSSESPGIAPDLEPSSTPEAPLDTTSPIAPKVEPTASPEQPIEVSPLIAPAVPSEAPETPIQ